MEKNIKQKKISVPLDTGECRDTYSWTTELRRQFGIPFSTFFDIDLLPGVNAMSMSENPSRWESCYDDETLNILDAIPGGHTNFDILPLMKMAMSTGSLLEEDVSVFVVYLCNLQTKKEDNLTYEEMEQALDDFLKSNNIKHRLLGRKK